MERDGIQAISWRLGHRNPVHILEPGPSMTTQTAFFVHFFARLFREISFFRLGGDDVQSALADLWRL